MGLGLVVAAGLVVAMQVPLLHQRAQMQSSLATLVEPIEHVPALAWPSVGSAALDIPALGAMEPMAFLAKREVGASAWTRWLVELQGVVYVDRQRKRRIPAVNADMARRMVTCSGRVE